MKEIHDIIGNGDRTHQQNLEDVNDEYKITCIDYNYK